VRTGKLKANRAGDRTTIGWINPSFFGSSLSPHRLRPTSLHPPPRHPAPPTASRPPSLLPIIVCRSGAVRRPSPGPWGDPARHRIGRGALRIANAVMATPPVVAPVDVRPWRTRPVVGGVVGAPFIIWGVVGDRAHRRFGHGGPCHSSFGCGGGDPSSLGRPVIGRSSSEPSGRMPAGSDDERSRIRRYWVSFLFFFFFSSCIFTNNVLI
jgi:hypothetical protein